MKLEDHQKRLAEHLAVLEESIEIGLVERQQTIGFSTSSATAELLEIFLHQNDLIDPGFILKHEWLKSKNSLKEKLPFDFPKKEVILKLASLVEEKRNPLCYGKPEKKETVEKVINNFNKLKDILMEAG